jgi:hypothetical protein
VNWGKSIILAFILFGGFIATLVTVCMRQDISLVTKEYYTEELAFQSQIDRMAHTAMLSEKPSVKVESGDLLKVTYNDFNKVQDGVLQLFRPSDPSMDKEFTLGPSKTSSQYFSTAGMEKGLYRARIRWTLEGQEFYLEQRITL